MDAWISEELRHAPAGLNHGWFFSNLEFYALQDSLSGGTLVAMALSVAVAFSVMLLTTWNIIISLYAILSIAGTIFVTVGSLVLLGWELNVLESVTISVAVGLSVDFAVHYGVAYRLAPEPDREGRVIFSLSRMGSAIAMAALTTFVAGAMMMPSTVLAYTQLGTFMMLIMCISWAFATFFFQCLCRCLGPQGDCGQIPLPKKLQCQVFSEVTSSGPSPQGKGSYGGGGGATEHYELEPLASNQKPDDKAREEREVCAQLCNGAPPHHHGGAYPSIQKPEAGRHADNGILVPPLRCQYPQSASCACADTPPPHLHQDWAPHLCAQAPQESAQLFPAADCHVRYVHCSPAHFHHCPQGRVAAPRQGPAHSCHIRNYCAHAASQQAGSSREQRPTVPNLDRGGARCEVGPPGPDGRLNTEAPPPKQPQAQGPTPGPPHSTGGGGQQDSGGDVGTQVEQREEADSVPVSREEGAKSQRRRAPSGSPKKLYCFNRTLKLKCSSASEGNTPKTDASAAPVAINAKHSSESLC